jgi:hypothetical protein
MLWLHVFIFPIIKFVNFTNKWSRFVSITLAYDLLLSITIDANNGTIGTKGTANVLKSSRKMPVILSDFYPELYFPGRVQQTPPPSTYNWRQSLDHEHSSMQAGGIDIMQRIVALCNFANTLTKGKMTATVFTLCDVAHRCYVIYTVHVLTISVSPNIRTLWYTIYYTGL